MNAFYFMGEPLSRENVTKAEAYLIGETEDAALEVDRLNAIGDVFAQIALPFARERLDKNRRALAACMEIVLA